ncbi:hypothetical protein D3C87_1719040 [compost metagenome]
MPMLVGDVRWAMICFGLSWKLSGGNQLSAGATYWSKNAHVLRASIRRNRRSCTEGLNPEGVVGRLIHQAIAGLTSHISNKGAARASA